MSSTGRVVEKSHTDRVEGLLASRRVNAILKQLSARFPPPEECGDNAAGNAVLLDTLVSLCHVFGDFIVEAVSLADGGAVHLLSDPVTGRSIYQVGTLSSQSTFTCLPSVNYCQCAYFQENVLRKQNSYSVSAMSSLSVLHDANAFVEYYAKGGNNMIAILSVKGQRIVDVDGVTLL